jgi:hypothetical protein
MPVSIALRSQSESGEQPCNSPLKASTRFDLSLISSGQVLERHVLIPSYGKYIKYKARKPCLILQVGKFAAHQQISDRGDNFRQLLPNQLGPRSRRAARDQGAADMASSPALAA